MYQKKREEDIRCPLEYGQSLLEGKWKTRILCELSAFGTLRYSELKADMEGITDSVLSLTLSELVSALLVKKETLWRENAPITYYSLTRKGRSVIPILKELCSWSASYRPHGEEATMKHCYTCSCNKESKAL